jgi:hypothetical protein
MPGVVEERGVFDDEAVGHYRATGAHLTNLDQGKRLHDTRVFHEREVAIARPRH